MRHHRAYKTTAIWGLAGLILAACGASTRIYQYACTNTSYFVDCYWNPSCSGTCVAYQGDTANNTCVYTGNSYCDSYVVDPPGWECSWGEGTCYRQGYGCGCDAILDEHGYHMQSCET